MSLRLLCAVAAMAATGLTAAGCGGGSGGAGAAAGRVEHTVTAALRDIARGDGAGFCALATPGVRRRLAAVLPGHGCAAFVHVLGVQMTPAHRRALLHARVRRVGVHGAVATVSSADITSPGGKLRGFLSDGTTTRLVRTPAGRWLIAGPA